MLLVVLVLVLLVLVLLVLPVLLVRLLLMVVLVELVVRLLLLVMALVIVLRERFRMCGSARPRCRRAPLCRTYPHRRHRWRLKRRGTCPLGTSPPRDFGREG